MGKSRKRRHIDRHAHRGFGAQAQTSVRERPQPMGAPVKAALPLPARPEPLVERLPQHDFRSRYPAKKTKHRAPAPLVPIPQPPAEPVVGSLCAPPEAAAAQSATLPAPVLLLTYRPRPFTAEEMGLDWYDFITDTPATDASGWCEPYLARTRPAAHPQPKPKPDPELPLPRSAAVTAWKKRGPFEIIGYWLRSRLFGSKPKAPSCNAMVAKLRAENIALRRQLARLESFAA